MSSSAPSSEDLAQQIAGGHSYDKHDVEKGEFPGVSDRDQFKLLVQECIENAAEEKPLTNGRYVWWNDDSRTIVIYDPQSPDGGTAFRPSGGKAYFDRLK